MRDVVLLDTNLLLLIVVVAEFSDIVLVPNVLTEVSNLSGQISGAAKRQIAKRPIAEALRRLVESADELYVPSIAGVQREEFLDLGLTDSVLISLLALEMDDLSPTLLSVDQALCARALSHGHSVIDYGQVRREA